MISRETFWDIHRLHTVNGLDDGQIARRLKLCVKTVRRWLSESEFGGRQPRTPSGILDAFKPMVDKLVAEHPYTSMQIYQRLVEEGYEGGYVTVRRHVAGMRPRQSKAYLALSFDPGEAAQIDFGCCGLVPCGDTMRRLSVCMIVLCHSRLMYAEFMPCERMEHFLACQANAFNVFGGVPRRMIVDNCKCAVLNHGRHGHVQFNPRYADFAGHCGFEPVACNVRSPHEKGRVENGIGYLKKNFLPGRQLTSLAVANTALKDWLDNTANIRLHGSTRERPVDRFAASESAALGSLPPVPFDCSRTEIRRADKRCRVFFDGNSYSVPEHCAMRSVTVKATPEKISIYEDERLAASHARTYDRNKAVVDPDHQQDMRRQRRRAREQNLRKDFLLIGAAAEAFLSGLTNRQINPDSHLRRILAMVEMHGADSVRTALEAAVEYGTFRAEYIEHLILQKRRGVIRNSVLHVPKAGDLLELGTDAPDMNAYTIN